MQFKKKPMCSSESPFRVHSYFASPCILSLSCVLCRSCHVGSCNDLTNSTTWCYDGLFQLLSLSNGSPDLPHHVDGCWNVKQKSLEI